MYDFGITLKNLRKEKGLTQKELGSKLNVTEATICKYENNTAMPPFETVRSLAAILNVSLDVLYGNEPSHTLSLHGLSNEQSKIMEDLAAMFRTQDASLRKNLSDEQYKLLGRIVETLTVKP